MVHVLVGAGYGLYMSLLAAGGLGTSGWVSGWLHGIYTPSHTHSYIANIYVIHDSFSSSSSSV